MREIGSTSGSTSVPLLGPQVPRRNLPRCCANEIASISATLKLDVMVSDDIITIQIASIIKNIAAIRSVIIQSHGRGETAKAC